MNEMTLKGMFLKETYKGQTTKVCLFYEEQAGTLAIGVNLDVEIDYKTDCLITVFIKGRVKQTKNGMIMYDNNLYLKSCNYIAGVEK